MGQVIKMEGVTCRTILTASMFLK